MRNLFFNLSGLSRKEIRDTQYVISQEKDTYSYFRHEYRCLTRFQDGSYVVPVEGDYENKVKRINLKEKMKQVKDVLVGRDQSYSVGPSSDARLYFLGEYRNSICEDCMNNIIIPSEEMRKIKTR